jgi:hypothetical protein
MTPADLLTWRLIETTQDSNGQSTIADDRLTELTTLASGRGLCQLWKSDHHTTSDGREDRRELSPERSGDVCEHD